MARVGIRMSTASSPSNAEVQTFFDHLKQAIADGGFDIVDQGATFVECIRAGYSPDPAGDDVPHWRLAFAAAGSGTPARIFCKAVNGEDGEPDRTEGTEIDALMGNDPEPPWGVGGGAHDIYFACDGREGWWWLGTHGASDTHGQFAAGSASRRYAADQSIGTCARYCVISRFGDLEFPWALLPNGSRQEVAWAWHWTPIGTLSSTGLTRAPGSPLPRMAAPIWPQTDNYAVAVLGELLHVMVLTDGYNQGDEPMPGWIALDIGAHRFALPRPASFTVVP